MRAGDHAEKRSLARAVGADKAADLLFRDVEANVFQRRNSAKVLAQLFDFQNTHVYSLPGVPGSAAFGRLGGLAAASTVSPPGAPFAWWGGSLALASRNGNSRKSRRKSPSRPSGSN